MKKRKRLEQAYKKAHRILIDESSKIIFFSDCHRGDKSKADDFAHNENIYLYAMQHYLKEEYIYIEVGDGDELWENKNFEKLFEAHPKVYELLSKFAEKDKLYIIYGNHDIHWALNDHISELGAKLEQPIKIYESIILDFRNKQIFCIHGHQVDGASSRLWKINRFFVRYVWKKLQKFGLPDPTSPAQSKLRQNKVEKRLERWSNEKDIYLLAGHTHKPAFIQDGRSKYMNTGSCIHPYCICGIEISTGEIYPVKWSVETDEHGLLCIKRNRESPKIELENLDSKN